MICRGSLKNYASMVGTRDFFSQNNFMPLTTFQSEVFKFIAQNRSPESYVAGGIAMHARESGIRRSFDVDFFHDIEKSVLTSSKMDEAILTSQGYQWTWILQEPTFRRAIVTRGEESLRLEWSKDSAFRFFPVIPDPDLGFRLHDADLATNKVLACAGRSEVRDFIDLLYLHRHYLPLGVLVWAACGKDEGFTPDLMLDEISKNSRFRQREIDEIMIHQPISVQEMKTQLISAIENARSLVARLPSHQIGALFLDLNGTPITPEDDLPDVRVHHGCVGGTWPTAT
jgi:hypothetical protein